MTGGLSFSEGGLRSPFVLAVEAQRLAGEDVGEGALRTKRGEPAETQLERTLTSKTHLVPELAIPFGIPLTDWLRLFGYYRG